MKVLRTPNKYFKNIVLIKDIEIDENNLIFRDKFNTVDFKTGKNHTENFDMIFLIFMCLYTFYLSKSRKILFITPQKLNVIIFCYSKKY